ncbi:peptidylprolyl isomerase [Estrella lausannensis]|uniref:Conserved putative secreted protein n=1 Tax=Estrella lausannensis TaxID=483423 RepID=A0A0H5E3P2_9BACT|nr:hypothetical protein [Estrella lausannensis]CRX37835.1 Conserved putative secreted protein [Estrella lausannensis]
MRKVLLSAACALATLFPALAFSKEGSPLMVSKPATHIEVNNRILANVSGKAISVYDLMKKMDVLFYRQYPQYASSIEARYQFYKMSWKATLYELIDKELIMLDAKEVGFSVSTGDIRQEMESVFGPNIHANLDKLSMSFEDAESILRDEIVIRRMLQARVGTKASRNVTPQVIKLAYEEYAKKNPIAPQYTYSVITIRDPSEAHAMEASNKALAFLKDEKKPVAEIASLVSATGMLSPAGKITVSQEMTHTDKDISPTYKEALDPLQAGEFSTPKIQTSKQDNAKVVRIFYLKEKKGGGVVPFREVESKIKDELMSGSYRKETDEYLQKMREHFHIDLDEIDAAIPPQFEPFSLK